MQPTVYYNGKPIGSVTGGLPTVDLTPETVDQEAEQDFKRVWEPVSISIETPTRLRPIFTCSVCRKEILIPYGKILKACPYCRTKKPVIVDFETIKH